MTYNAQGIGKSGARKRLVDEVLRAVNAHKGDVGDDGLLLNKIFIAVFKYKKETSK